MADIYDPFDGATQGIGDGIVDPFDQGYEKPGVVLPAIKRVGGRIIQGAGQLLDDAGVSNPLTEAGRGIVERNPQHVTSLAEVQERPLTFAGETISDVGGQVGASAAGTGIGAGIGGFVGGRFGLGAAGARVGAKIGGVVGGLAPIYTQTYGGIRDAQQEQGIEDIPLALLGAGASSAVERLGLERAAASLVRGTASPAAGTLMQRMGRGAAEGALVEAPTEVIQSGIERFASFQPLTGDEATEDYIMAGLAGAVGGAGIGAGIGAIQPTEREPVVDPLVQRDAERQQDIASVSAQAVTDPNAGPLTRAVGFNPGAAAEAGAAADQAELAEQVQATEGRAPSEAKEFSAQQKRAREDESFASSIDAGLDDLDRAIGGQRMLDQVAAAPLALPAPQLRLPPPESDEAAIQRRSAELAAERARPAAAQPVVGADGGETQVGAGGEAFSVSEPEAQRVAARREEADALSGRVTGIQAPEREIRNPKTGEPWNNALAPAQALKKRADADQWEVRRLGQEKKWILARKGAPSGDLGTGAESGARAAGEGDLAGRGGQNPSGLGVEQRLDGDAAAGPELSGGAAVPVRDAAGGSDAALTERREDAARRKTVAEMSPEERAQALLTHELTGIPNRRAYEEAPKKARQASLDVDSLKWVNDNLGHEAGDHMLRAVAAALREEGADAYHVSGDEFIAQGDDDAGIDEAMARVNERLKGATIRAQLPDGRVLTYTGIGVSYGKGKDLHEADTQLQASKSAREAAGLRAARGEQPPGVAVEAAEGQQDHRSGSAPAEAADEVADQSATANSDSTGASSAPETPDTDAAPGDRPADAGSPEGESAPSGQGAAVRRPDGTPFPTKLAAGAARSKAGQKETHDIVPVDGGGFELRPKGAQETDSAPTVAEGLSVSPSNEGDSSATAAPDLADESPLQRGTRESRERAAALTRADLEKIPNDLHGAIRWWSPEVRPGRELPGVWQTAFGDMELAWTRGFTGQQILDARKGLPDPYKNPREYALALWDATHTPNAPPATAGETGTQVNDAAPTPAAQDERTPKQIEREAYSFAASLADVQAAAAGEREGFNAKAGEALRAAGYGQYADDPAFLNSLHREAKKRHKEAELEKNRDPAIYQAKLAEAMVGANLVEGQQEDFKAGFDHALAGRTKSTITGDVKVRGYEAARLWMQAPEGRAFYRGEPVNKLKNTGADLRRWFDKLKQDAADAEGDWRGVWKALEKATVRSELFRPALDEAAPGARRMAVYIRDQLFTFKEFVAGNTQLSMWGNRTFDQALDDFFSNPDRVDARLKQLRAAADEYIGLMERVSIALSGATDVAGVESKARKLFFGDMERDSISSYAAPTDDTMKRLLPNYGKPMRRIAALLGADFRWAPNFAQKENEEDGQSNRKTPLTRPRLDIITRNGRKDHRAGRDITPEEFKETFGLADVGFGKWVKAKADQDHLNYAFDAFMDLAELLGISPKHIGLGGSLHFTIGALGHGRHAAHYQPQQAHPDGGRVPVINVTNTRGDGTVAHEWSHALDFALKAVRSAESPLLGPMKAVVRALQKRHQKASVDKAVEMFFHGGWSYRHIGRSDKIANVEHALSGEYGGASPTAFKIAADKLGEGYWGNDQELFARAMEAFVYDKLFDAAQSSDYLVTGWVGDGATTTEAGYRGTPYPQGEERAFFNRLMGALFEDIEFTDKGPRFRHMDSDGTYRPGDSAVERLLRLEREEFEAYKKATLAKLPEMRRAQLKQAREQAGTKSATDQDADRLIAEQRRREEQRLALEAAEALARPAEVTSDKALSEDELSALFDDAAAELREAAQETPETPPPGEPAGGTRDAGGSAPRSRAATPQPAEDRTAAHLIAEASKLGVKGIDEALKGLSQLFGGPGTLRSFPGGLDREQYEKAKPHFEAALKAFQAAGKTIKDLFRLLIQTFGEGIKPYAIQFAREKGLGADLAANPVAADTARQESNDASDRQGAAGNDRDGDAGARAEDARTPEDQRGAGRGDRTPDAGGKGLVSGSDGQRADGDGDRAGQAAVHGAGAAADDATEGGSRGSDRPGDRVPERKRDGRNYLAPVGGLVREGSWRATAARNLDIVELVKKLDAEGRQATAEEQAQLVKFTGWGASEIAQNLFPSIDAYARPEWKDLVRRRASLMSAEEKATAARSTQYAHYTSEAVTRSIWQAVQDMGFTGGNILEPGMGIGLFPATAPESVMAQSRYTGIEMDAFTAKIAQHLFQRENVIEGDYSKTKLPRDFFDIAIGNPPFGSITITNDPEYAKYRFLLHDYFFAKTLDRVRPGGLLVFVTSHGTMDKAGQRARKYMADRADLLGAIRLPQTAFKDNAGTEVVTDILFLKKRAPGEAAGGEAWLNATPVQIESTDARGNKFSMPAVVNEYFQAHPEMVLGTPSMQGSMYRANEYTVLPPEGAIEDALRAALAKLPRDIYTAKNDPQALVRAAVERDFNPKSKKEGTLYVSDKGELMRVESGTGVGVTEKLSPKEKQFVTDYIGLRDAVKQAQYDQLTDGEWEKSLKALGKAYDAFVKKHGHVRAFTRIERREVDDETGEVKVRSYPRWKNEKLLRLDVESPIVEMLEAITEDDQIVKANFLNGRTIKKPARPEINSVKDALMVALDERGRLDLDFVASLAGKDRAETIAELGDLIYETPAGNWTMADEYLSGDVVTKLEEAEAAAQINGKFRRNVEALLKVQPKPLSPQEITVQVGAGWVPVEVYEQFASEVLGSDITIEHIPAANSWKIDGAGRRAARGQISDFGTPDRSALEIFETALMGKDLKVTRTVNDGGKKTTYVDRDATTAANEKLKAMKETFSRWIWQDAQRGARMAAIYNRQFNNLAPRKFDGSHLTLPGLSLKYKLYDHQKRAIWRVVQTGDTYLAHAVGAGKTLEMIVSGMEMKRLGLIAKPMYAVPKHMLKQFAAEFLDAYPAANILVADDKNFDKDNRGRFVAQAALNNPDAIIITHPAFTKLAVKDESRQRIANRFIGDLQAAISEESDRFRRKEMEAQLERLERRFEAKAGKGKKDDVVDFEDIGADFLFVDEAHEFRKLDFISRRGNIKGIDPNGSARALDLFIKIQHLQNLRPGRAAVLASGTPIVNTIAELYSVMRMLNLDQLEADGLDHFDVWANQFGDVRRELEQNAAGQYEFVERFAQFVNVPELMKRVRSFMDVLTSTQLGSLVKRPDLEGNQPDLIINPASERLLEYLQGELAERIETSRAWKPSPDEPHNPDPLIAIISDGRLAAIDMRFVDSTLKADPDSKLTRMLEEIVAKHKEINDRAYSDKDSGKSDMIRGGTQIVFSAVGFGEQVAKSRGFDVKGEIVKKLTAGGIRRDQIAFMDEHSTDSKKAQLFKDMRAGKIRVLFGSPKNMGTGVNVQKRLSYLHFLSPPWYPADVEQPHGRILRQGNQNAVVGIKWYATKGTYDSTMWQMVARKQKFIEQAFTGDDSVRKLEDVSESSQYEMASALSSGDQRAIQLAGLNADIERLTRLRNAHHDEQATYTGRKNGAEHNLASIRQRISRYEKAAEAIGTPASEITLKVGDKALADKAAIGETVRAAMTKALAGWDIEDATYAQAEKSAPSVEIGLVQGKYPLFVDGQVLPNLNGSGLRKSATLILKLPEGVEQIVAESERDPGAMDPAGLYTRLRNRLGGLPQLVAEMRLKEQEYQREIASLNTRIGVPFQFETDLFEKTAEAAQLKQALAGEAKGKDDAPQADIGDRRRTPLSSVPALRKALDAKFGAEGVQRLIERGMLKLVAAPELLPREVRGRLKGVPLSRVRGVHDPKTGTVYIVASNTSPAEAASRVLHEIGEHYGLPRMLGKQEYARLLNAVRMQRRADKDIAAAWAITKDRYGHLKEGSDPFVREVIARLADDASVLDKGWFARAVAAVRRFLIRHGLAKVTADDIRGMLAASTRQAMREIDGPALTSQPAAADLAGEDTVELLEEYGQQVLSALEAERLQSNGWRVFTFHEQDEAAEEITHDLDRIRQSVPDALLVLPPGVGEDEVMFDLAGAEAGPAIAAVRQKVGDMLDTGRTFNRWWHNTVGTQYHKAQVDQDFGRVFNRAQEYLTDVSRIALGAAERAPDILPRIDSLSDLARSGASPRELKPVAEAIFRGTLEEERIFTDAELRDRFKLNPKQIDLYKQARRTINKSLTDMLTTEMVKLARTDITEEVARRAAAAQTPQAARDILAEHVKPELVAQLDEKIRRVADLIQKGYAPLMRFGQYSLHVTDKAGETQFFGMYESAMERNRMQRQMREQYPDATVTAGVMNDETYQMFRGVSPETLEIFAAASGMDQDEAFQQYLKLTKSNRSALKRLIHRKGIEGYNPDLKRVLAQFVTSNARAASGNLHMGELMRGWQAIPRDKGDVQKDAGRLIQYIQNPKEEAQALRGFLFYNFLGGSVASAAVNMTQPFTMSFPYLAQWGAGRAAKHLAAGMKTAMGSPASIRDAALRAAMQRAIKEGTVEPHQIHELSAAAMRSEGDWGKLDKAREAATKGLFVWGRLFSLAEQFNRRSTFAAAFQIGRGLSAGQLREQGVSDAYEFAVKAVNETQGIYNRGNRPNWARGAVGATIFTFKQFSISYVEFLKRLPRRERALALGVLFLAAGAQGMPGADDLDDLIDTLLQTLGIATSAKEKRRELISKVVVPIFGQGAMPFIENGVSEFLPIDVQGRLGMGNLIPGSGIGLKSTTDKSREISEAVGPVGGVVENLFKGAGRLAAGDAGGAAAAVAPVAVQNALRGLEMAQGGFYRDERGRRVIDTTAADAMWKSIGLQPQRVARESRQLQEARQRIQLTRTVETEIADRWATGLFESDPQKVRSARERLMQWNRDNPTSRIRIEPAQIRRRLKEMRASRQERFLRSAPQELRQGLREELGG